MSDPLDAEDVVSGRALEWPGLVWRGLRKRCPRCGGGGLYRRWFHMAERCPSCGYLFEREPGFFIGAYFINFVITEGLLGVIMVSFLFWKAGHPEAGVLWPITIAVTIALVAPLVFYPTARTVWSAIDLAMRPIEVDEIVAAIDAIDATDAARAETGDAGGEVDEEVDDEVDDGPGGEGQT